MEDANRLLRLEKEAEKAINQAQNPIELNELKLKYLGRKSELVLFLRRLKDLETDKIAPLSTFAGKIKDRLYLLLRTKESEL